MAGLKERGEEDPDAREMREKRERRANSLTLPFPTPATHASNESWSNFKENVYEARGMCYQHKRDLVCCIDTWKGL